MVLVRKLTDTHQGAEFDGELVLVHGHTGKFYVLKGIGLDIWQRIDNEVDFDWLCGQLSQEFDADEARIRASTKSFVDDLVRLGFAECA